MTWDALAVSTSCPGDLWTGYSHPDLYKQLSLSRTMQLTGLATTSPRTSLVRSSGLTGAFSIIIFATYEKKGRRRI